MSPRAGSVFHYTNKYTNTTTVRTREDRVHVAEERPKKIALIGASGHEYASPEARIECFAWDRLKKAANLADYDVLILNLLSVEDPRSLDAGAIMDALSVRTMLEVLFEKPTASGSSIFVLGDPRFNLVEAPDSYQEHSNFEKRAEVPFLFWTGADFTWDNRSGDTIECGWEATGGPFKPLADNLGRWRYGLESCEASSDELSKFLPVDEMRQSGYELLTALVDDVCKSRYGSSIVFAVRHVAQMPPRVVGLRNVGEGTVPLTAPIYFLPESKLSEEETLEFVLRDLCGVDVSAPEPEWISHLVAPGQEEVDRKIAELEDRINALIDEHDREIDERNEVRKPLKLLYETGTALEEGVWFVLEALGAEVERPEDRTKEDGWLTVRIGEETFEGVLEVKGVKSKYFNLEGLRQLTDWIERGMIFRKKKYSGIFVGNSAIKDPPGHRIWPFNKNWVEQAEMRGYVGIRTEDLYAVYLLNRTGRLDRNEFWRGLFSTIGPFDMQPYRAKLITEEEDQLKNLPRE